MRISIVTLSFNQRPYLMDCLKSVAKESPEEFIVVDPGSTDGSRERIDSFGSRVTHRIYAPDRGPADGLNKGFMESTGDVLGFINADDLLCRGALREVRDFFASHPQEKIVMGDGVLIDAESRALRRIYASRLTPYLLGHLSSRIVQPATFFRREVFESVGGFNIANRTCWDGEFLMDALLEGYDVRLSRKVWASFRLHSASITTALQLSPDVNSSLGAQSSMDLNRLCVKGLGRPLDRFHGLRGAFLRKATAFSRPGIIMENLRVLARDSRRRGDDNR